MENDLHREPNYWKILSFAEERLAAGDFAAAEHSYHEAAARRAGSPGRVFFSEKVTDGLKGLFKQSGSKEKNLGEQPGRWSRRTSGFRNGFLVQAEPVVREGVRVAELRPEDDARTNQPVLESALFLVARSRIFQEESGSAVLLLKGLFRTAIRTGRPFDFNLIRHDLPLTEDDRLWLARKGGDLVEVFLRQGTLIPGTTEAADWAGAVLRLLQPVYFGSTSLLEEERSWLEAVTADRLLARAGDSVDFYRAYLGSGADFPERTEEAGTRLLELLGNADAEHFPVPRYEEALALLSQPAPSSDPSLTARYESAASRIRFRRPSVGPQLGVNPAWASSAPAADGRLAVVFWWDNEPRDVAWWKPGDDPAVLDDFLGPCGNRLVTFDEAVLPLVTAACPSRPAPWLVRDFMVATMEPKLPPAGLDTETVLGMCLAETGPWRSGWDPGSGNTELKPPRSSSMLEAWEEGPAAGAVMAGLAWLAVRSEVVGGDPTLRAGIGELGRRGDSAAKFLYEFICMDSHGGLGLDSSFQAWTLPLLWTRPDPFGWSATGIPAQGESSVARDPGLRPDLARNDLAIVATGDPQAVLSAWGDGHQKLRVVLDRLDRLESLARVSGGVIGPVTLIPPTGTVHSLASALDFLDWMLEEERPEQDLLLPIFHWQRLVTTHNGDLLDFRQVRPRPAGSFPLYDHYAEAVKVLEREEPKLDPDGHLDTWAGQFSQRVRKAGLVAGPVDHLAVTPERLDSLWGVFEGSDASWVFLDSAAIHWRLLRDGGPGIQEIHFLLHSRGRRHLSLLTGAVWLRQDLEALLGDWLGVFGSPYYLSLTDGRPPALRLAGRGVQPEADILAAEALASQATWVARAFAKTGGGYLQIPASGRAADFWNSVAREEVILAKQGWRFLAPVGDPDALDDRPSGLLAVPSLASLEAEALPVARSDSRADWAQADLERTKFFAWRRQVCSLEIAALLAGPWDTVAILDNRWWRLLLTDPEAGDGPAAALTDSGGALARWATGDAARTLDLPGSDPRGRYPVDGRIQAQVHGWLMTHDQSESPPSESAGQPEREAALVPSKGVTLLLGDHAPAWQGIAARVSQEWERGRTDSWILLVADAVPPDAADLVASAGMAGLSVWTGGGAEKVPAPVVWVEPEDFSDPGLGEFLIAHRPAFILASDVRDWKPGSERESQETALALKCLLDCRAETVLLHSREAEPSWVRFLTATCGARLMGAPTPDPQIESSVRSPATEVSCLDCGRPANAAAVAERLHALLPRLRSLLADRTGSDPESESETRSPGQRLVPLTWLGDLAGLEAADVAEGVRLLRWAARLAGDSLSTAGSDRPGAEVRGQGHTLIIKRRFAEFEKILDQLESNLGLLLPLWLGPGRPGLLNWIDLEYPPAVVDPVDLGLLDGFLVWNGGPGGGPGDGDSGLTYTCPRGLIHSTQRLVGCRGPWSDVHQELVGRLHLFRSRIEDVMAGALETGDGFLVETGLTDLRDEERSFLGLGSALGFWRWNGPPCPGAIHLVDLLTVAESPTAQQSSPGWDLVREEAAVRYPGAGPGRDGALESTRPETGRGLRGLRSLLTGGAEKRDDLDPVVRRVTDLMRGSQGAALLVLKGVFGSGRHEAVVRGLLQGVAGPGAIPEVTVYCPDQAVAAMVSLEFLRLGLTGSLDVRIPPGDTGRMEAKPTRVPFADPSAALVLMCEVQRFDPETRYRIAQAGRGRRLIMTVDPAAVTEPWEHLFLTTPRADDIVDLPGQRRSARKLWSEVRRLVPPEYQDGGWQRRDKGGIISDYAANLDQGLSRLVLEHKEGRLQEPLRLTAPMPGDLEYLGSSMRDRGWLAVLETRLEGLLLPGPREFLAAATDQLILGGHLNPEVPASAEGDSENPATASPDCLIPALLGNQGAACWRQWVDRQDLSPEITLQEFADVLAPTRWANTFLWRPEARQRIARLLEQYGTEPLAALPGLPLWEAWWYSMVDALAVRGPGRRRPLAVLTSAARPLGMAVAGAAYLCLGTEPARQHYESLVRVTDSLLVLYQEKSPLPSESPE